MRIGIFGGTFDPVHYGHIRPIEVAARKFQLSRVLFVPARVSPHKTSSPENAHPTDARHRVAMLALALQGRTDWTVDLEELDREPPSYTIDTLRAIRARRPEDELWLLMGTDVLAGFARWREPEEILRIARVAAFHREPYDGERVVIPEVSGIRDRCVVFDAGSVRITATEIRNDLALGKPVGDRVPGPVAEYVTKQGLYRPGATQS
jgi:nicotinate-nucleotide adenylyltransferase